MGIAKEIFGLNKIHPLTFSVEKVQNAQEGYNHACDLIDAFEISEEAIAEIIYPFVYSYTGHGHNASKEIAAAIKANAGKIFVGRGK